MNCLWHWCERDMRGWSNLALKSSYLVSSMMNSGWASSNLLFWFQPWWEQWLSLGADGLRDVSSTPCSEAIFVVFFPDWVCSLHISTSHISIYCAGEEPSNPIISRCLVQSIDGIRGASVDSCSQGTVSFWRAILYPFSIIGNLGCCSSNSQRPTESTTSS